MSGWRIYDSIGLPMARDVKTNLTEWEKTKGSPRRSGLLTLFEAVKLEMNPEEYIIPQKGSTLRDLTWHHRVEDHGGEIQNS